MSTDFQLAADVPVEPSGNESGADETGALMTTIERESGWQPINFRELWAFRELIYFLAWRDVKVRYKQTALGALWAIIQPAMLMIVFTVSMQYLVRVEVGDLPYPLFAYLGVLPWTFFSTSISNSGNSVVGSERLVAKVYFPRLAVPIASVGASMVDFLIAFGLLAVMMVYYSVVPGAQIILVPVVVLILTLTALGVGMILSALNVLYRDFRYVIPFMMQIWMFATPTIYLNPDTAASDEVRRLIYLNPLTGLIETFRNACLGREVNLWQLAGSGVLALALFFCGAWFFRRLERQFADII